MRLTIARKIALAVIAIVILCIGTMAWVTSSNLQRGFINYLNDMQAQDLDGLRDLLAERYRREGNFEWLRRQPRALREVLDQMKMQLQAEPEIHRRPPPEGRRGRPGGRDAMGAREHPPEEDGPPPEGAPDGERDGPPERGPGPERASPRAADGTVDGRAAPPFAHDPLRRPERRLARDGGFDAAAPPPARADAPPQAQRPPPGARDPMGFASRVSVIDADGSVLMGPPERQAGIERAIVVDGKTVGVVRLRPLRQATGTDAGASGFLREQLRDILWLSCALIVLAILLALWLARHLLRPVAALRDVTAQLARGQFHARAPLLSRDELAELALHVNEMAQALEHSEQQRRRMLAEISHELRTPLSVIRGELEALIDGIRQADPRALESLHAEVLRLNKLVDDLHQLTLADAGDLHFQWQQIDLVALLQPLLERYQARAAAAGLALSWSLPAQPVTLEADGDRLTQVVLNLLENSVRYTEHGGRIHLNLAHKAHCAELTVDDSAPGVPAGAHARLFERLYRVDQARTRDAGASGGAGGSGLGLAICKMLVEAHGGTIDALPSALGGLKMQLVLPLGLTHRKEHR
ncbi:MAG: ATP-binding protein [Pseudomonadota bacterium]